MPLLADIRQAIATTLMDNIPGLVASPDIGALNQLPVALVVPSPTVTADYTGAFARGLDEWNLYIYVIVSRRDDPTAQQELDSYLAGFGANSIRQVLFNNPDVGLEDTQVSVLGVKGYGGHFKESNIAMSGAIIVCKVYTSGSA